MKFDFDLFVIGAGSGGVRAARLSARFGARVAIAEERYLGGTCVNVGCIPKKLFVYASHFGEDFADARGFGWEAATAEFHWPRLLTNKNREIGRLHGVYARLLRDSGAQLIDGRAQLVDPHTVVVGEKRRTAERILVATGGWPRVPEFPGHEHAITSNEVFQLPDLPRRAVVVGGGYIAVEFAGILHGLGVHTTQLYRGDLFLRGFDHECRTFLAAEVRKRGVDLRFNSEVVSISKTGAYLRMLLADGTALETDLVLYATGRGPNTSALGLEAAGVRTRPGGAIEVNESLQTSVPHIYAIGDVTDRIKLTPVATAEGTVLARSLFGGQPSGVDYRGIPSCIFSQPNFAMVGLTEEAARKNGNGISVFRSSFTPLKQTLGGRSEKTLMKLIVDKATDRVLGAHMVGPDAGEIIQGIAVAMKAGATKAMFDATIGIHPTAAEEFVTMRMPDK
ncbi:MAG: glutathione-disulfide reductase [Gammaproteobacteria bacterium]|nr:glutathione-disulfide reductase [Gammaproteobacteria bacterium]